MSVKEQTNIVQPAPVPNNRFRIRVIQLTLLVLFCAVLARLIQFQIIESEKLREEVEKQIRARIKLQAERGTIFDRHENIISTDIIRASFAVDPKQAKDSALSIAKTFGRLFGNSVNYYMRKIRKDSSRFEWLVRFVDLKYGEIIQEKNYNAVIFLKEPQRLYYHDRIAGQLIGTTDQDNTGIAGIEKQCEDDLRGTDGSTIYQRNGLREIYPTVDYGRIEPINGHDVHLTIDLHLQAIAEKELRKGAEKTKARSGTAIIIEPHTGEILAMAQYPQIKSNQFNESDRENQRLRAITDQFEPGSVFKIITASAAIENKLVSPNQVFDAENGKYNVTVSKTRKRLISDIHKAEHYTFSEALIHSSNIVMAKISDIIGKHRFYEMARAYGFGTMTNIEFPGEVQGRLNKPKDWSATTLNSMAFGYEVSATPLQIAFAYAAVANKGELLKPIIVKKITDASGNILRASEKRIIRRVISPSTAEILTRMMEGVVEEGTGTNTQIKGIRIAGKTGTAKKNIGGEYQKDKYIVSFAGFFPAENPKIVCLVMIDEPSGDERSGSLVCAPIFRAIAEQIINTTDYITPETNIPAFPNQNAVASASKEQVTNTHRGRVPDVCGLSIRRAMEIIKENKLKPSFNGSGIVTDQVPEGGKPVPRDSLILLICQPRNSASLGYR